MDTLASLPDGFEISPALVTEPDIAALISKHVALMQQQSPPEACHVMTAEKLSSNETEVFVVRTEGEAVCVGALKHLEGLGEIKSMHTAARVRGRGLARALLRVLLDRAREKGIDKVYLETGSGPEHAAARALYASEGFEECPAFGSYEPHPLSLYMMRNI